MIARFVDVFVWPDSMPKIPIPPTRTGRYIRDVRAYGLSRADAEAVGIAPSARSTNEGYTLERVTSEKARVERLRHRTELAHVSRRPGQTLADRVREIGLEPPMSRRLSDEARDRWLEGSRRGGHAATADARTLKAAGMAAARAFRESRRCHALLSDPSDPTIVECGALGWQPCVHRPDGAGA